jgi:hypothetical protein
MARFSRLDRLRAHQRVGADMSVVPVHIVVMPSLVPVFSSMIMIMGHGHASHRGSSLAEPAAHIDTARGRIIGAAVKQTPRRQIRPRHP